MVELVDSVDLGSTATACRFESCCPHQKQKASRRVLFVFGKQAGLEPIQWEYQLVFPQFSYSLAVRFSAPLLLAQILLDRCNERLTITLGFVVTNTGHVKEIRHGDGCLFCHIL